MIRPMYSRTFLLALVAASCLGLTGCPDERKPFPSYDVVINADGSYVLDGRRMSRSELRSELAKRAADPAVKRPSSLGNRAAVRLIPAAGTGFAEVQELVNELTQMGYNNIETTR